MTEKDYTYKFKDEIQTLKRLKYNKCNVTD